MAHTLEELPLYLEARKFWGATSAILTAPGLRKDHKLREQIESANDSIDSNLKEGFEQPTDAAFANFVFTSKGSVAEVLTRSRQACEKGHITSQQLAELEALGQPLGKMMGGFIKYLHASGFTDRGRHSVAPTPRKPKRARK
jgi:four helix bundle protein